MLHTYITALKRSSLNWYAFVVSIQVFSNVYCEEGMANVCIKLTIRYEAGKTLHLLDRKEMA